jgi:hypothetical protein
MATIMRGEMVGVVDGPAMILTVKGEERKLDLAVDISLAWISEHMNQQVTVMVDNSRIVEVM